MKSFIALTLALASTVLAIDCGCNKDGVLSSGGQSCEDRGGQRDYVDQWCIDIDTAYTDADCEAIMANWGQPAGVVFPPGVNGVAYCRASE
ncbi:hypothetical protein PVAG01_10540 [Phlyctema vagabunda]|uniref:Uncharacterized protein n=1 Tax=Phlyctema vagabunda TaxID=108571 RepID=A0ABR4P2J9_9HELO